MKDASELVTVTLAACGAVLAAYSYLVLGSVPLTALGIGALIVAASIASSYKEPPYSEAARVFLEAYAVNVARLLEEFGASFKAIYFSNGFILIPLTNPTPTLSDVNPDRLVSGSKGRYGLLLKAPQLEAGSGDPESVLTRLLVDTLGICDGVRIVRAGGRVLVEIVKPREPFEAKRFSDVLGSVSVHLAAVALTEVLRRALQLEEIKREGNSVYVTYRVIEDAREG